MKNLGVKQQIATFICQPLIGKVIAIVLRDQIPNRGCKINTHSDVVIPSIKASVFWGLYESAEVRFVQKFLKPQFDVVELGSSIGVVSSHIAQKLDRSKQLICVEADPRLLKQINLNISNNSQLEKLNIIHGAINYTNTSHKTIPFTLKRRNVDSKIGYDEKEQNHVQVPTVTLSEILRDNQVNAYSLVSDIEGAEIGIFVNEDKALANCQQIIIELHEAIYEGQVFSPTAMSDMLQRTYGFTLRAQRGAVYCFDR